MAARNGGTVLSLALLFMLLMTDFVAMINATPDREKCRGLESQLEKCSRYRSPPEQCCNLAEDYSRRCSGSSRTDIGRRILDRCEEEKEREEREEREERRAGKLRKWGGDAWF